MNEDLIDTPQAAVDAVAASWAKQRADELEDRLERIRRYAEVLLTCESQPHREIGADLIEMAGSPS